MAAITKKKYRVALLDDDPLFCRATQRQLDSVGIGCVFLHNFDALLGGLETDPPDLILLDLDLGGDDGHSVCRKLRALSDLPIIMLTGTESANMVVSCLEVGADDYVTKPFDAEELAARIRAVVRRRSAINPVNGTESTRRNFGALGLDVISAVISGERGSLQLSNSEAALLLALIDAPPARVDRDPMCPAAVRPPRTPGDRTQAVRVGRLRKKINAVTQTIDTCTLRGSGYALRAIQASQPK
ncbi:MAG: response regulator [Spongiibacteraceae bacterium]